MHNHKDFNLFFHLRCCCRCSPLVRQKSSRDSIPRTEMKSRSFLLPNSFANLLSSHSLHISEAPEKKTVYWNGRKSFFTSCVVFSLTKGGRTTRRRISKWSGVERIQKVSASRGQKQTPRFPSELPEQKFQIN